MTVRGESMTLREIGRYAINGCLSRVGVRLVNARWGPCGLTTALEKLRAKGIDPKEVVDVGGSDGRWSLECMRTFPGSDYFIVDPLPSNLAKLERLATERRNVRYWSGCLGPACGRISLPTHGDQSSFFESRAFGTKSQNAIDVEMRDLDSFLGTTLKSPDFLKLDVQGAELQVLNGAARVLEHAKVLLIEVSFRPFYRGGALAHEVIAHVSQAGFGIYDICSYVQRARDYQLNQCDLMFLKLSSPILQDDLWE